MTQERVARIKKQIAIYEEEIAYCKERIANIQDNIVRYCEKYAVLGENSAIIREFVVENTGLIAMYAREIGTYQQVIERLYEKLEINEYR